MRGALQPLSGVKAIDVRPGDRDFTVAFDPAKTTIDAMLAALRAAREPAVARD